MNRRLPHREDEWITLVLGAIDTKFLEALCLERRLLTEDQLEEIEKLVDKLEDDDDVQAVYTNAA